MSDFTTAATSTGQKDVFFCHASEEKHAVVQPIVEACRRADITFWYDEAEIVWGDSVTQRVNDGLAISRFVVVVLSDVFLEKPWPRRELNAVLNLEASTGVVRVLPLIVGDEAAIIKRLPLLNDKLYLIWNGNADGIIEALQARLQRSGTEPQKSVAPQEEPFIPRLKRGITDRDRDLFLKRSFDSFREYFESAMAAFSSQYADVDADFEAVSSQKFQCRIYVDGELRAQCRIWRGGLGGDGIAYYEGRDVFGDSGTNAMSEVLTVFEDHSTLRLRSTLAMFHEDAIDTDDPRQAAEIMWKRFSKRLESSPY